MNKHQQTIRLWGSAVGISLALITASCFLQPRNFDRLAMALGTIPLVLAPIIGERLLKCRFSTGMYLFSLFYALGPMMGHCWYLYYTTVWWDKLLHISGGVMFALVGVFLCQKITHRETPDGICLLFGLFFSISIAAVWEFVEFGADQFLGLDMQNDRLVTCIHSYLLGESTGSMGGLNGIRSVTVDGISLPGYIDIGLIDTMLDMILESLGAEVTCILLAFDKGKHPAISRRK